MIKDKATSHDDKEDIFRTAPLRYLGYTNEIGESFGTIYPRFVRPSYVIAFTYCTADTIDKFNKAVDGDGIRQGADCFLWQTLASVLIPGKVINYVTHGSQSLIKQTRVSITIKKWSPTMIGLATIPFIIKPIDDAVDYLFDNSLRKWWPATSTTNSNKIN